LVEEASRIVYVALIPLAQREWQSIIVINNAGTLTPIGPASNKERASVIENLNTNFTSGIVFMTEVLRHFQNHEGSKILVNISSGAAQGARAGWSLYCAAKAGLEHFIRSVALEQALLDHPFTAINIDPGLVDTDMQTHIRQSSVEDFPALEQFKQRKETGLLVAPEKVAAAILRIVDRPDIDNGQRIPVDVES
jgi:benzil reductase ((S)-benzoin forming)